jgi:hypothetical protein
MEVIFREKRNGDRVLTAATRKRIEARVNEIITEMSDEKDVYPRYDARSIDESEGTLTRIIRICDQLYKLDHSFQNLNSDIPRAKKAALHGHHYALQIKELLPQLKDYEVEPARAIIKQVANISYLIILRDHINSENPNGFWWKELYKELDERLVNIANKKFNEEFAKNYEVEVSEDSIIEIVDFCSGTIDDDRFKYKVRRDFREKVNEDYRKKRESYYIPFDKELEY